MKRALRLLLPITFLAAILAPGCYTVVMHPMDDTGYRAAAVSDCTRCHADYDEYPYGYYYSPYPSYWWDYPHYGEYYAHPWWWSRYDQSGDVTDNNSGEGDSDRGTKYDRRDTDGPPPPPYAFPNVGIPRGSGLPPNDFRDTGGGNTGSSRPQTETGSPSRDKTEQNDKAEPVKNDTKTGRQEPTKTRPEPQKESTVKNEPPKTDTSSKDAPKKEEEKEKPPRKGMNR